MNSANPAPEVTQERLRSAVRDLERAIALVPTHRGAALGCIGDARLSLAGAMIDLGCDPLRVGSAAAVSHRRARQTLATAAGGAR